MKPYELTYIISSIQKSEEAANLTKEIDLFIQEKGGVILKSEKTVPQSLAYPIKKISSGYFVTIEFQGEEKEIKALQDTLEKNPHILRHFLIIKRAPKKLKERRTRKPLTTTKDKTTNTEVYKEKTKKESVKIENQDIDKKLDEILSE